MREINIDLSNLDEQYDCGNCGEIKASKLNIDISKMAKADFYVVVFRNSLAQTYCTDRFYEYDIENGIISVELWQDLTKTDNERAVVEAYTEENDKLKMLEKSAIINLNFDGSISSDDALNEEAPEGLYLSLINLEGSLKNNLEILDKTIEVADESATNAVNVANNLMLAKANGEFDGPQGIQGEQGIQGPPGKDAVIDTILSPESSNAIANSTVAKVLSDGNLVGIELIADYEQLMDFNEKYTNIETGEILLKNDEYVILFVLCDIFDESGEYNDPQCLLKKAVYIQTYDSYYEIGEVSADDISAINKAINAVNKRLDDINIGKVNVTDFNETVEELRSPRTKLNKISVYLPDLPDGVYELESKYNPPLTLIRMSNISGDTRKMFLNNGDIFALATDSEGVRSLNVFTASGCFYIYDISVESWDGCYCLTYDEASKLISEQIKALKSSVDKDLRRTNTNVTEALTIAKGKNRALVFTTFQELNDWINGEFVRSDGKTTADLQVGDNLYIVEVGVPDYWWDGNTIQVLETQKVDLSGLATKEHWMQVCDDILEEDMSYILKTVDEQGNPLSLKKAIIYIYAPIAQVKDGLVIKCTENYVGTTEAHGYLGYVNSVINSTSERHTLVKIDASSGLLIQSSFSNGTTYFNMGSNKNECVNTLYTSIEKLLIRTNNSSNVFPAGTRIRIWGC